MLPPTCAASICINAKKITSVIVPKETFGIELQAVGIPVKDNNKNIIRSIVLGTRTFKNDILEIAKNLSTSMDQIAQATSTVSDRIQNLVNINHQILIKSNETKKHAEQTDDILNITKNIAQSTNLL